MLRSPQDSKPSVDNNKRYSLAKSITERSGMLRSPSSYKPRSQVPLSHSSWGAMSRRGPWEQGWLDQSTFRLGTEAQENKSKEISNE